MAAIDEEKQETSFIERLMFVLIPIVFLVVLLGVLLTLFDIDFRAGVIKVGQDIPIVRNFLPEPTEGSTGSDGSVRTDKFNEKLTALESELATVRAELAEATTVKTSQESTITTLQEENDQLKQNVAESKLTDEEYNNRIVELASMFAKMTPSKAAPIMQSMTLDEMALIFSQMRADDRVKIMEKMTPQIAADVTLKLKDNDSVLNMEIAALQAQVKKLQTSSATTATASQVSDAELAATFSDMEPKAAADMLVKMMDISSSKVLRILKASTSTARSAILEEIAAVNKNTAAMLVTKLMQDS
ncbi:MAG: MgtE protein [Candidatus Pristimantibacillus lignocellulolyticus]|uniref:MgtE protein n=1 Tax=Candidatus Pristimantibacillus lignocellulolyticus TaxID=2994561 RepID=A0A9J6ZC40_9BACL|nr:MAG: MgtE protein [Candidatus Pristimantibacillus lignocellulolyticus]